ncbi:MAG: preprotein translocase subunit SecG [Chloroflexi bacterium]|nr:preprotein translocase subunit SecG [Chloroflexota bacterium]
MLLEDVLRIIQLVLSLSLIGLILFQASGSGGVGTLFGGGGGGAIQRTRRGLEKTVFQLTIGTAIAWVLNAILQLLIQ